jgi:hypothetical protein
MAVVVASPSRNKAMLPLPLASIVIFLIGKEYVDDIIGAVPNPVDFILQFSDELPNIVVF